MPQTDTHQETGVLDPRQISVPLLVVVPVVAFILTATVWGVRKLDQTAADIAAVRAALSTAWTVADQREWGNQLGRQLPGLTVPDPADIQNKLRK